MNDFECYIYLQNALALSIEAIKCVTARLV